MKLHYLQHVPFEGIGRIQDWADSHKHLLSSTRLFSNDRLPALDNFDLLVIMGGPMGANDDRRFKWMATEKAFIEAAIEKNKPVLGICLGSQLIASILGARVYANREKEIGWFPIELDPPEVSRTPLQALQQRSMVFHWHGDTFDLPKGARHLARSRACENQAFVYGEAIVGLQFHLEVAEPHIENMIHHGQSELVSGFEFIQDPRHMMGLSARYAPPLTAALYRFLDKYALQIGPVADEAH